MHIYKINLIPFKHYSKMFLCCDWDCRRMTGEFVIHLLLHTLQLRVCVCVCVCMHMFSHVQLFVTPCTVALPGSSVHEIFPGKNTGMGCHFLLLGTFAAQGLNPHLRHRWADSSPLHHLGSPEPSLYKTAITSVHL